jgi:hypothetical protein
MVFREPAEDSVDAANLRVNSRSKAAAGNNSYSVLNPIVAGAANRISQDVDMVTVVNYKFGGPVVARY